MSTIKYTLLGGILGLLVASFGWVVWWAGAMALGDPGTSQISVLVPAVAVGVIAAGLAGAVTAWLQPRPEPIQLKPPPTKVVVKKPPRKKRRNLLDRHDSRARVSPTLRWLAVSKPLGALLRFAPARLVGKPIFDFLHPEDVPAVDRAVNLARTSKQVQPVWCRLVVIDPVPASKMPGKGGSESDTALLPLPTATSLIHVRLDIAARTDRVGTVRWFDCRFTDATALALPKERELHTARKVVAKLKRRWRTATDDLARLKLSYRELYQHAPVMYFSMDHDGKLVTFNDTLVRTLGYDRRELQNKNYTLLLAPATLKSYLTIAEAMPAHEGELETQWRKKDGTVIDVWLHSIPVVDERGQIVRYRSAALDLTERSRLANELRSRGDELERTNQRLRTINSELEAFTHVVSHDLKEPLRTLQAYSHILAEEHAAELGPDGFQYINHLIRASRRLGALIDELLNLSQAGRITHAPKVFNVLEIVATVRQDLVDLIQRKEASIVTEASLPDVVGDPARITQLLTNLITNGIKYNKTPRPEITVGARPSADEPGRVIVYVRDNGIGIDPAFHAQIFGIFRRLHQEGEFEGTGAGLAICKKIVEGHGGRIWVESQVGQGATFFFTLPRSPVGKPAAPARPIKPSDAPSSRQRKTALHSESSNGKAPPHIVLVEDQADVAMIIQKLGKRDGLAITWFPTAEDAWDYLRSHRADLLLLDVNLPGMNGIELCRRIRVLDHLKDAPVAMFTPAQDADKQDDLRAAGADYFLTKDLLCQPAEWQQKMQELLSDAGLLTADEHG